MRFAAKGLPLLDQNEIPTTMTVTSGSVPWVTLLLFKISPHFLCQWCFEFHGNHIKEHWMRALASHQCGLGSNPGDDALCGLSLLLVISFALRGCSLGTPGFPLSSKINISKFQYLIRNQVDEEELCGCATSKSLFIYLFIKENVIFV